MAYEAYVDKSFYTSTYKGIAPIDSDFDRLALRASDEIDKMTCNIVRMNGIASYPENAQEAVKLATCSVLEGMSEYEKLMELGTSNSGSSKGIITKEKTNGYEYEIEKTSAEELLSRAKKEYKKIARGHLQRGGFSTGLSSYRAM